jgi:hypothetical protein
MIFVKIVSEIMEIHSGRASVTANVAGGAVFARRDL